MGERDRECVYGERLDMARTEIETKFMGQLLNVPLCAIMYMELQSENRLLCDNQCGFKTFGSPTSYTHLLYKKVKECFREFY